MFLGEVLLWLYELFSTPDRFNVVRIQEHALPPYDLFLIRSMQERFYSSRMNSPQRQIILM
jgi:hypothetical protein